jgi:hypothetical protein
VSDVRIPIPRWIVRGAVAFEEWGNVPIWTRGRLQLRRLDVPLVLLCILTVAYYGWQNGWIGAMSSLIAYVAMSAVGLAFRK